MKQLSFGAAVALILSPGTLPAAVSPVVISEFMASNSRTLADEDGSFEDWIEILNVSTNSVALLNWSLTDNAGNLTKWQFPATNLPPDRALVVFASNKNRRTPGAPLHTNFKLDASGEYLALVQPDGVTVAYDYAPAFPPQVADVSFGLDSGLRAVALVSTNAAGRFQVPSDDSSGSNWLRLGFDDSSWRDVRSPVGYSASSIADLNLTNGLAGYWRFDETNGLLAADASNQGHPGALRNFPSDNSQWVSGRVGGALRLRGPPFRDHVFVTNYSKSTTQLTVSAWAWADARPLWASIAKNWAGGDASHFHLGLTETAGDLSNFIRQNNADYGLQESALFPTGSWQHVAFVLDATSEHLYRNGVPVATTTYSGHLPTPTFAPLAIGAKIYNGGAAVDSFWQGKLDDVAVWTRALSPAEIQTLADTEGSLAPLITTDVRALMYRQNASCYLRFPFVVPNPDVLTRWRLRLRYSDGFVAWLNGEEIVRRYAPETLRWDSAATGQRPASEASEFEEFDLSFFREFLLPGTNILALQGLNRNPDDSNFFLQPVLVAASVTNTTNAQVYFTAPTPGADNFIGISVLGPILKDLTHAPKIPNDSDDLLVTAHVAPAFAPVQTVTLRYRIMFSNEVAVAMLDDGAHGDGAAGDGIYGALIPAGASNPGQMVRYYITAADSLGRTNREPLYPGDPNGAPQYFGTVVRNPAITSDLPIFEWFAQDTANAHSRTGTRCAAFYRGEFYDNVFVRERGGFTSIGSQKFDFNRGYHFLVSNDLARVEEINLNNNTNWDPSYLRPTLGFETYRQAGVPACIAFSLLLRLNGASDRVGTFVEQVDQDFLRRHGFDPEGALYKLVQAGGSQPGFGSAIDGVEKKTRLNEDRADMQAVVDALNPTTHTLAQRAAWLFDNFDIPNLVSYFATRPIVQDQDSVRKNHYLYRDTRGTGEWQIFPWDKDLTFGVLLGPGVWDTHPLLGTQQYPLQNSQYSYLHDTLLVYPSLKDMVLRRMRTLDDQLLQPPGTPPANAWFETTIDRLIGPVARHVASASNAVYGANGLKSYFPTRRNDLYVLHSATNIANADRAGIPAFSQLPNATVQIATLEVNPASSNQAQEYLCLTNGNPFALDISGWRLEGAVQFTFRPGTVLAASNVLYVSPDVAAFRARPTGPRGGLGLFVVGNYQGQLSARGETVRILDPYGRSVQSITYPGAPSLAQQFLRITELMYRPAPFLVPALAGNAGAAEAGPTSDAEEFEFIELKNISTNVTLDLRGVRFVNGLEFNFADGSVTNLAPGATVLVVKNLAAFSARYPTIPAARIAGQYLGNLENGGERLQLVDAVGEEILDFTYDNQWYEVTDGLGFSLVVVDDAAAPQEWNSKTQWRPSAQWDGSPAVTDPPPPVIPSILITEVLSRTEVPPPIDSIELYNPTAASANLSGWFLSDDFRTPKKFRIPAGTVLGPGGYVVFDESQFNAGGTGFAFSSDGDEAWLFSANTNGTLTGYAHGFSFGAASDGVSFGRYVTSVGEEHFVAQARQTLGTNNAAPLVGPLIISEIMYRPADDGTNDNSREEFIELENIGGAFGLYDPLRPTNTWTITGGVEFAFPPLTELGPAEILLLVNFDPATNAAALATFRAKYSVPGAVRILGPYRGKLDNSSDAIELRMPTTPLASHVPYVLVEKVRYRDSAPWPAGADGFGISLQRKAAGSYGNDPTNWVAAWPTAGRPTALVGPPPIITTQPTNQTVLAQSTATLGVIAISVTEPRYQWRFNGVNLPGATNATLQLTNVQPQHFGNYQVLVANEGGSTVSSNALLNVIFAAVIFQQPQNQTVFPETSVTLAVSASSSTLIHYQWRFNAGVIPDATNAAYTINNVLPTHEGDYSVELTDSVGTITSQAAHLTVLTHPLFTLQPTNRTVILGSANTNATFTARATSSTPIAYQWQFNGTAVLRATNTSLTLSNVQVTDSGIYTLLATDNYGSSTSAPATLRVLIKPAITLHPVSQTVVSNATATFTIAASGTTPISFRWRRNNLTLNSGTIITNPNSSALILTNVKDSDAAIYNVAVTNLAGAASGLSSNAVLTVLADSDGDGIPDDLEPLEGAADSDGDGMSNAAEYFAGTDWLDPKSYLKVEIVVSGSRTISFNAVSNRTYSVQYTDGLNPLRWEKLIDVPARNVTRPEAVGDTNTNTNRYYRLVTPIQP